VKRFVTLPLALVAIGILVVAGILASMAFSKPAYSPPRADAGLVRPAARDSLTAAIDQAQARLRDQPADAATWAGLGSAYVQQARATGDPTWYPKAEGALRRSLRLAPDANATAMTGLGALANARHDFALALSWARRAQKANPWDARVYGVLDDALTQLGDYPAASAAAQRMLDLQPGIPAFTRAAYHFEEEGRVAAARGALRRALAEAVDRSDITFCRYQLGELAFDNGDPAGALQEYRAGLVADPGAAPLVAGRAKAEAALGQTDEAVRDYADVTARVPTPQYVLEYAELLQSLGHDAEAEAQLQILTAEQELLAANGVVDDLTAATVEADHGSATAAVRHAEAEWARRRSVLVEDALAWALHRAGRDREALPHAVHAGRLGWQNAGFRYHRGQIELSLGRTGEARRDLAAALRINPHFSTLQAPVARRALASIQGRR
jgi:tetratricopeptide (TPR) repeat protein